MMPPFILLLLWLCRNAVAVVLYKTVPTVNVARAVVKAAQPYSVSVIVLPNSAPLLPVDEAEEVEHAAAPVMLMLDVAPEYVERVRDIAGDILDHHSLSAMDASNANQVAAFAPAPGGDAAAAGGGVGSATVEHDDMLRFGGKTFQSSGEKQHVVPLLLAKNETEFTVSSNADATVILKFEGIPGTGYKWIVDHSLTSAELKVGRIKLYPCEATVADTAIVADKACMYHVKVVPMEAGNYTLTLLHARPWDRSDNPSWKIVHFNVGPRIPKTTRVIA